MSEWTEYEIDAAIAEYGMESDWEDLSDKAKEIVRKLYAEPPRAARPKKRTAANDDDDDAAAELGYLRWPTR